MAKKKPTKRIMVPRTRNANTLTESMFWSKIRSALRQTFQYWKPMQQALENASRPSQSKNKALKKEYLCKECVYWFPRKEVHIDHIEECGSLRSFDDIQGFIERLTIEDVNGFQVLCKPCHLTKSKETRDAKKST
jgi:hypothetical protein